MGRGHGTCPLRRELKGREIVAGLCLAFQAI